VTASPVPVTLARMSSGLRAPLLSLALGLFLGSCGGTPASPDAARADAAVLPDASHACTAPADCDDGLFCTGVETCTAGSCGSSGPMRCDDGIACTIDACSEAMRACVARVPDVDGDGAGDAACVDGAGVPLGEDCDDTDPDTFPDNREVCDSLGHDEDCDLHTHGGVDLDGDAHEDATCCNGTGATRECGDDCDDVRRGSHPGSTEVCNRVDDDCNGMIDEGVRVMGFHDRDFDGYGGTEAMSACGGAVGFSVYDTDCDDTDPTVSPGRIEVCDGLDNDCDPNVDESAASITWYRDADGDGFGAAGSGLTDACVPPTGYSILGTDCDDTTSSRSPGAAEVCNGIDDDCSGRADYEIAPGDSEDDDGDGLADLGCGAPRGVDCNDGDAASGPGTEESCDGRDNDCDTHVDEDVTTVAFFRDEDGDGWGASASGTIIGCAPVTGYVRRGGDCDDTESTRHPSGTEGCNATDDDCDGAVDEAEASVFCALPHTLTACVVGICQAIACDDGFADCSLLTTGCETDVRSDPLACGSCSPCPRPGSTCTDGVCVPPIK
jgi:hypothetical protein